MLILLFSSAVFVVYSATVSSVAFVWFLIALSSVLCPNGFISSLVLLLVPLTDLLSIFMLISLHLNVATSGRFDCVVVVPSLSSFVVVVLDEPFGNNLNDSTLNNNYESLSKSYMNSVIPTYVPATVKFKLYVSKTALLTSTSIFRTTPSLLA